MNNRKNNKKIFGYTAGVYDLFHVGHLNLLKRARSMCDHLTVGVSVDELVKYKHKKPVICYEDRKEIVKSIKYVDRVVKQEELDKFVAWKNFKYDILFVGDDWKGSEVWNEYEKKLKEVNAKVIYLPYTKKISSTLINQVLLKLRGDKKQNYE